MRLVLFPMTTLKETLDDRFDCIKECEDIATHGCAKCAPTGFVYYCETFGFYTEYEGEIEDQLYEIGYVHNYERDPGKSIRQLTNNAVWAVIEHYCATRVDDEADRYEYSMSIDDYSDDAEALASAGYIDG